MDFSGLQYFLAIVKHRNLTRAAQELYISQPTLTKFLQKLESEIGGKVFRKNGHQYELTFLGQRFLEYAQKINALNQDWHKELSDMRSSFEGELNIAVPPMRSACLIPQFLPEFHQKHPGVHINFFEYGQLIQDHLLTKPNLDFGILSDWQAHPNLNYELLKTEEMLLILPPDHPLGQKAIQREGFGYPWLDLSLLAEEPFILHFPEQTTGRAAQQLFDQYHIQPPVPFLPYLQQSNLYPACIAGPWGKLRPGELCKVYDEDLAYAGIFRRQDAASWQARHRLPEKFVSLHLCAGFYPDCQAKPGMRGFDRLILLFSAPNVPGIILYFYYYLNVPRKGKHIHRRNLPHPVAALPRQIL